MDFSEFYGDESKSITYDVIEMDSEDGNIYKFAVVDEFADNNKVFNILVREYKIVSFLEFSKDPDLNPEDVRLLEVNGDNLKEIEDKNKVFKILAKRFLVLWKNSI